MNKLTRRSFIKTSAVVGSSISLGVGLSGCDESEVSSEEAGSTSLSFAVISDPHIYDSSLGTSGEAFESYLSSDRKMLVESVEILETMVTALQQESDLNMVIIPGDLTKDGELICHEAIIDILQPLRDADIKVYVIPGNHDINNPDAVAFIDDYTEEVDTISAEDFRSLYADFGYDEAIYTDENSLSYIVEPIDGVWLVALDSCKYSDEDNVDSPETTGEISEEVLAWLQPLLATAQTEGKVIFGMMHHGIVAHFDSQSYVFPEYLVDDYETVGEELASYGLNLIFTGHFHAQDAVSADYNDDGSLMMYDVETGSAVTYPSPYRLVDLDTATSTFDISSNFVDSIDSMDDFETYSEAFITEGMETLYTQYLSEYGLDEDTLSYVASLAASLHVAHYQGDENTDEDTLTALTALMASEDTTTAYLGSALYSLAVDSGLGDNDLSFSLADDSTAQLNLFKRIMERKSSALV